MKPGDIVREIYQAAVSFAEPYSAFTIARFPSLLAIEEPFGNARHYDGINS
jgi:hypothetical protein